MYQEVILRISPLGKLGCFESTAEIFFCLNCFNQLSDWANPKYYLLVLHWQRVCDIRLAGLTIRQTRQSAYECQTLEKRGLR